MNTINKYLLVESLIMINDNDLECLQINIYNNCNFINS